MTKQQAIDRLEQIEALGRQENEPAKPTETQQLSAQIAQKQAELDRLRADKATLQGVAKMAEVLEKNPDMEFHVENFPGAGGFYISYGRRMEDGRKEERRIFRGEAISEAFAQLLEHFK